MMMAVLANLLMTVGDGRAQSLLAAGSPGTAATGAANGTGIRTDRLNAGHRKIWQGVERILAEMDRDGQPIHPRLHSLWQWAQQSRHAIFVEMVDHEDALHCSAGEFTIENSDQEPQNWTAVIRLNLSIIRDASAKEWIDGSSRFTSLLGTGRNARCAAFFGHELVHASLILQDPAYARLYHDFKEETAAYYAARGSMTAKEYGNHPEMRRLMSRLQSLMDQLEAPVNAVEVELWRGLIPGLAKRGRDRHYFCDPFSGLPGFGIDELINHQQLEHLRPRNILATRWQMFLPETGQPELLPELTR